MRMLKVRRRHLASLREERAITWSLLNAALGGALHEGTPSDNSAGSVASQSFYTSLSSDAATESPRNTYHYHLRIVRIITLS